MSWRSELVIIDSWWLWQLHPYSLSDWFKLFFCGRTSGHQAFRWLATHCWDLSIEKLWGKLNEMCSTADCCRYCISNYLEWHMKYHQLLHRFQKGTHKIHAPHGSSPDPAWINWDELLELPRSLFCPWDFADQIFRRRDLRWGKKMFRVQLQDFPDCSLCLSVVWKCLDVPGS